MSKYGDGIKLKKLLDQHGLKSYKFAKEIGIPLSTISTIINGRRDLSRPQIQLVCEFFRVSPSIFFKDIK